MMWVSLRFFLSKTIVWEQPYPKDCLNSNSLTIANANYLAKESTKNNDIVFLKWLKKVVHRCFEKKSLMESMEVLNGRGHCLNKI